jgi:radical SAM enzyme (TIGR01210 family)
MLIFQILPSLLQTISRIAGKKTAMNLLNSITKNRKFFFIDKIYDFDQKSPVIRLTVLLPGKGCEWAIKTGGCTMCAFGKRAQEMGKHFSGNDLYTLFQIAINLTKTDRPFVVSIYNGGSFLNEKEIPFDTQLKVCQKINEHFSVEKLFIESRVEFINKEKIKILKKKVGRKKLIIGIGLEAQDDKIRNVFIKKGLNKKDYENAVKLLKENGIKVLTYVFLKPIYISEREAIEEAIKTIEYAFKIGTDEVALESGFVQESTLMARLFKEKKYRPPWLWSIIEVIKKTYNIGPLHVGGFSDEPPPIAIPHNCPLCSSKIEHLLQKYRETHNIELFSNLRCDCYKVWKEEMEKNI